MDTMLNQSEILSIQDRETMFSRYFSLGTNANQNIAEKFELLNLICYLSFVMHTKDPQRFKKPLDVLQSIYNKEFNPRSGEDSLLISLGIICNDLLYGVTEVQKPEKYTSGSEICARIKDLINQWLPF